jgi:hypothetical protein
LDVIHTDIGAAALKNECAIVSQDPTQVLASPQPWRAHGLDQVGAGKERNVDASLLSVLILNTPHDLVQLMVEVVQDLDGREVLLVQRLPRVNADPL